MGVCTPVVHTCDAKRHPFYLRYRKKLHMWWYNACLSVLWWGQHNRLVPEKYNGAIAARR